MSADTMGECCRTRVAELVAAGTAITVENLREIFVSVFGSPSQRARALRSVPSSLPKGCARLIRRMNRQIKSARGGNKKKAVVELLLARKTLLKDAKRELHAKQCARNMENFSMDPMQEYRKVFKQDDDRVEPAGTQQSAEDYLRREFHPPAGRIPCPDVVFPAHTPPAQHAMPDVTFTASSIIDALEGKKGSASPGRDGVTFGMLKLVPVDVLSLLAECFNKILRGEQEIPLSWVFIRVKMLHKGKGKDPTFWDSFRPICISSCVGKLFNAILGRDLLKCVV
eukprot:TRINITY_DN3271_c0_g1_i1.p3 TRINITY_DN3271_c0_g1~~TRINITY_DN3271_c0_g1_i1.p3  ORF type:complete len:283 (-),score=54.69 TRINITY_DN3271_c0_g1_i1:1992-2840(-)